MADFYRDVSGSLLGPDVRLVRTLRNGDTVVEYLPATVAKIYALFDSRNGDEFVSSRIVFGELLDVW